MSKSADFDTSMGIQKFFNSTVHLCIPSHFDPCPWHQMVTHDMGLSRQPDTALDMPDLAGHGKTAWLLSSQQQALYKKHGSVIRNLSLWISSCVHCIRDWFSVSNLSTKPLTVWKTPGCAAVVEHSRRECEGNTAQFVQCSAAGLNTSVWFKDTKELWLGHGRPSAITVTWLITFAALCESQG